MIQIVTDKSFFSIQAQVTRHQHTRVEAASGWPAAFVLLRLMLSPGSIRRGRVGYVYACDVISHY